MGTENILKKNKELKGLHSGRRCFILGCGPSIGSHDLSLLRDEIKIPVNNFFRHSGIKNLNPDYWVCADPTYFREQETYLVPLLSSIEDNEICTKLFFPMNFALGKFEANSATFLDFFYYKYDFATGINDEIDFQKGIPPYGQNVVLVAIMLAFYLGCNPIYLLGCDHSWWAWKREEYIDKDTPHFFSHPNKIVTSDRLPFDSMQSTIFVQKFQYLQLIKYAQKRGFRIFNATKGGCLDLFPRARYEDLFPPGTGRIETEDLISALPDITSDLAGSAIELINRKSYGPALVLVDEARRQNTGKDTKIEGLDFLKAVCLSGLGEHRSAIEAARQDYNCNPSNRDKAMELLRSLGDDLFQG